jgi:hypothetical protein
LRVRGGARKNARVHGRWVIALSIVASGCGSAGAPEGRAAASASSGTEAPRGDVVGPTTREEIEAALPAWRDAAASAAVDEGAARELASVPPGAEVVVYLGTWCGDSRREIARLFRALEVAGEPYPFAISFVGVDRAKTAPGHTEGVGLRYVPTVVVRREGAEVGRIVESAPRGIERELVGLLTGEVTGVVTARGDL